MSAKLIEKLSVPQPVKDGLIKLSDRMVDSVKAGKFDGVHFDLGELPEELIFVKNYSRLIAEIDEVIDHLNICLRDLDALQLYPKCFPGPDPFQRYKHIIRMYFYEYARNEDIFGYFLLFMEKNSFITKAQRKEVRNIYYKKIEPFVRLRNVLVHDSFSWEGHINAQITMLRAADMMGGIIVDKATGAQLGWKDELGKVIDKNRPELYQIGRDSREFWNGLIADVTHGLVREGKL